MSTEVACQGACRTVHCPLARFSSPHWWASPLRSKNGAPHTIPQPSCLHTADTHTLSARPPAPLCMLHPSHGLSRGSQAEAFSFFIGQQQTILSDIAGLCGRLRAPCPPVSLTRLSTLRGLPALFFIRLYYFELSQLKYIKIIRNTGIRRAAPTSERDDGQCRQAP